MHRYYCDLVLRPDEMAAPHFLWEKLYMQIHLALVSLKNSEDQVPVGLSFPEYDADKNTLGRLLRINAPSADNLTALNLEKLNRLYSTHVDFSDIREVPSVVSKHVVFHRIRTKANVERLARRRAKRHSITFEQAMRDYSQLNPQYSSAPYIQLRSLSVDQRFRLYIGCKILSTPVDGMYSCYGLSQEATVPWF